MITNSERIVRGSSAKSKLVWLLVMVLSLMIAASVGCSCSKDKKKAADKKKKDPLKKLDEKPKPDFESESLDIMPVDATLKQTAIKAGHWFNAAQEVKSNKADFLKGEFISFTGSANRKMFNIQDTNYQMRVIRPAALPKGQRKNFELLYYAPKMTSAPKAVYLHNQLNYSGGGTRFVLSPEPSMRMRPYQYYLLVLCQKPDRYTGLKVLRSIRPPADSMTAPGSLFDYLVVLPKVDRRVDIPSHVLAWTSIAYIVWDDFDAKILTRDQQQAMIDWLQWGGQIIVSAPDSIERLRTSFLAEFLPAKGNDIYQLDQEKIEELNEQWTIKSKKVKPLRLAGNVPQEAVRFELQEGGQFIEGTADLLVERRVGRGRIVMTGFRLEGREFQNWSSFDNLFNNCLLRRAPRKFLKGEFGGEVDVVWDRKIDRVHSRRAPRQDNDAISANWAEQRQARAPYESLLTTKLRYFSRDAIGSPESDKDQIAMAQTSGWDKKLHLDMEGYTYDPQAGVAGWGDNSVCSNLVRDSLNESGGIEVPDATFILGAMGIYLVVLVPANWIIFRTLDRVEWAWFAVPIIAIIGTYLVVKMAQLDIGFARSRTEIGILETQPGFDRGHLTRYIGLYTSLTTRYNLGFSDPTSLVQPFAGDRSNSNQLGSDDIVTLRLGRSQSQADSNRAEVRLEGVSINSNSTGMVHSEQMLNMGGALTLKNTVKPGRYEITNDSDFTIKDVGVVAKLDGRFLSAWLTELMPKHSKTFEYSGKMKGPIRFEQWNDSAVAGQVSRDDEIEMRGLFELALDARRFNEGDVRLVGWMDQEMPGLTIRPTSSQRKFRTLLVANLRYGSLPRPLSDANAFEDVYEKQNDPPPVADEETIDD